MLDINKILNTLTNEKNRVVFLFALIILSFNTFSKNKKYLVLANVVKINDSTYIDATEISNQNWREYYSWNQIIYGDSIARIKCGIDDKFERLDTVLRYGEPYARYYFKHPAYNDYPKIGISYQQAIEYCKWRTDRAYEKELIKNKIIKHPFNQDSSNYFTIDRFLNGLAKDLTLLPSIVVRYHLPTLDEYKSVEKNAYENYVSMKSIKNPSKKKNGLDNYSDITTNVYNNFQNQSGIYNLIGNVSEMTNIEGVAYGGNWTMKEIPRDYTTTYFEPTIWLGFRCIAKVTNLTDYQSVYNKTIDQ